MVRAANQHKRSLSKAVSEDVIIAYADPMSAYANLIEFKQRLIENCLDLLFPAQCPNCQESVDQPGAYCAQCWSQLNFITDPRCVQCGYPFEYETDNDMKCASCLTNPPAFDSGISVMRYDDASKSSILAFKHADRTDLAPAFARWLAAAGSDIIETHSLFCPVPLHLKRIQKRRYNQSALLAKQVAKLSNGRYAADILQRIKNTPSQGSKNAADRIRNVKNAFQLNPNWQSGIIGKHVILIDDVYTTGATLNACAACLKQAGANKVSILTLSRVVRATKIPI
jgi:ComF family protein